MSKHKKWLIFLLFIYFYLIMREIYKGIILFADYGVDLFYIYNDPRNIIPYTLIVGISICYAIGAIIQVLRKNAGSILSLKIASLLILSRIILTSGNQIQPYLNVHAICFSLFIIYFLLYISLSSKVKAAYPKTKLMHNPYALIGIATSFAIITCLSLSVYGMYKYSMSGKPIEPENIKTDDNERFNGYVKYPIEPSWKESGKGRLLNKKHVYNSYTKDSSLIYVISSQTNDKMFSRKDYNSLLHEYFSDTIIFNRTYRPAITESYSIDTSINGYTCYITQLIINKQNTIKQYCTTGSIIHDKSPKILSIIMIDNCMDKADYHKSGIMTLLGKADFTPLHQ